MKKFPMRYLPTEIDFLGRFNMFALRESNMANHALAAWPVQ